MSIQEDDDKLANMRRARTPKPKPDKKRIRRESDKTQAKRAAEKKLLSSDGDTLKEQWFKARRGEMTGVCQCGCGEASQKHDNIYFRHSAAHIFPKATFKSVEYHKLNWVERRFWAGINGTNACHTVMDEGGLDRWPNMADWDEIKEKLAILAPLLTKEEKATNFYKELKKLVFK